MGDTYLYFQLIGQPDKILFEQIVAGVVASASVAEDEQFLSSGVPLHPLPTPPAPDTVAGEFAGVPACSYADISCVVSQVINAVRNDYAVGE